VRFTVEEGDLYRFGATDIRSHIAQVDGPALAGLLTVRSGNTYNAEAIDKTTDALTIGLARRGYPFATVKARSDRNSDARTVDLVFAIDEGARTYVERIDIRGNTRTRDYVIRREFDIAEGDAFNRALIDRAERRLKALAYFKTVKITTSPGSTPDRVVVEVDLDELQTGDFTFGGGYSTVDGVVGNISIGDRNFLGTGQTVKTSLTLGQYTKSLDLSYVAPDVLDSRMSFGADLFGKQNSASTYQSYGVDKYGFGFQLGAPVTDEVSAALRYSLTNQNVTIDPSAVTGTVSLPIQQAAQMGPAWVSAIGYTLSYNSLDDSKNPTDGIRAELRQDLAGIGGGVDFLRTSEDVHAYQAITDDIVAMGRVQSGYLMPWGGQDVPLVDRFFGGPQIVRGFAPNGFGPRDLTPGSTQDNIGGTLFWGTTAEAQAAIPYLPSDFGLKVAVFADAGSVRATGTQAGLPALSQSFVLGNSSQIRSSFGAGLIWGSPFGPLRVDYAVPVTKQPYDVTQRLGFSAGGF
jgi:outer membrane protein insertion porin family